MSIARIDISSFDDTELGAEVRQAHASGRAMVILYDSTDPDLRAGLWQDGMDGLYKLICDHDHVWLSALTGPATMRTPLQDVCPTCGRLGDFVET